MSDMDTDDIGLLFWVVVILIVVVACCGGCFMSINHETGSGSHECTIYAMENSGLIWQTWQVWVVYDGQMVDGGDVFTFDPANTKLAEELHTAMICKQKVHITYDRLFIEAPWQYGSSDVITSVTNATAGE